MKKQDWIIIPSHSLYSQWVLYKLDRLVSEQDYARDKNGLIRQFTTRSGARGVRSRLRREVA